MKLMAVVMVLLCAVAGNVYAAVDAGEISVAVNNSTKITVTFDGTATTFDSLYFCYRKLNTATAADTVFVAYVDSATTDTTYTALTPNTLYACFALARNGGTTNISGVDTVRTYKVPVQDTKRTGFLRRLLMSDASWTVASADTDYYPFFILDGKDASDYSLVFQAKDYNGVDLILSQAGDSCAVGVYFHAINCNTAWSDTTFYRETAVTDSIPSVTTVGLTRDSISLKVGQYYQAYVYSHTGNGHNTKVILDITSTGGD